MHAAPAPDVQNILARDQLANRERPHHIAKIYRSGDEIIRNAGKLIRSYASQMRHGSAEVLSLPRNTAKLGYLLL